MRLIKNSAVFVLSWAGALSLMALAAGCDGCNSCLSKPAAEDVVPTAAARAPAFLVVDASAPTEQGPNERDEKAVTSKEDAASGPVVDETPVPRAASLPRPKGPMPTGAYQACGRYDGPHCEKGCPNGNCRQECDGVDCSLTCAKGYCSQMCGEAATCRMTCSGGHCIQTCTNSSGCVKECTGGNCT